MKYATMRANEDEFAVRLMCQVLSVSPSGYYAWRSRTPSQRAQARSALDAKVKEAFRVCEDGGGGGGN